ncbi:hypothetical protein CJ030_MR8G012801 [Morella rubra]|uniref:Uncharacterized protein n=1 Tax=Morella rubra TaxID=262757 RepID=A0A6A1USF7_9ROSI|nr:hypothetical protein CJ030_MR8G012801 [Morella rubra]
MKRAMPWSDEEEDSLSDESWSSHSDLGADDGVKRKKAKDQSNASQPSKDTTSKVLWVSELSFPLMSIFSRNFRIESKDFQVTIRENGELQFSEWSPKSVNAIHMGKYGAMWMVNMSDKLMEIAPEVDFASKFNESSRGFLAQRCLNKGGRYAVIVEYGGRRKVGAVMVPEGKNGHGWQILNRVFLDVVSFFRSSSRAVKSQGSSSIRKGVTYAVAAMGPVEVTEKVGGQAFSFKNLAGVISQR